MRPHCVQTKTEPAPSVDICCQSKWPIINYGAPFHKDIDDIFLLLLPLGLRLAQFISSPLSEDLNRKQRQLSVSSDDAFWEGAFSHKMIFGLCRWMQYRSLTYDLSRWTQRYCKVKLRRHISDEDWKCSTDLRARIKPELRARSFILIDLQTTDLTDSSSDHGRRTFVRFLIEF